MSLLFIYFIKILCKRNASKNLSENNEHHNKEVTEKLTVHKCILHELMDLIWYTVN